METNSGKIILIVIIVIFLFIGSAQSQKNDDMEEAEILPPENHQKSSSSSSESTATTLTTPKTTPSTTDKPYPANFLKREVLYPDDPSNNSACIIFQGSIQLHINGNSKFGRNSDLKIDVPTDATASGLCGTVDATVETLQLSWNYWHTMNKSMTAYMLELKFELDTNNKKYDIQQIFLLVSVFNGSSTTEPNVEDMFILEARGPFDQVDLSFSYLCIASSTIMGSNLTVLTTSLQFEAFRPKNALPPHTFSTPKICQKDNGTMGTAIGIGVGSFLVLLLAVGFATYVGFRYGYCHWSCCNRRNSSGYQRLDI